MFLNRSQGITGAAALILLATGCGGGGGGGSSSVATTATHAVTGSVTLPDVMATSAAAKSAEATTAMATTSASITLHSYKTNGTLIETRRALADGKGVFSSQITLQTSAAGGGYLVIDVRSPNTSGWSKRITYTDPSDIDINAELRAAQTVVSDLSSPLKASAEGGVFSFGVVRYADGSRKAVAGKAAIAAAKASEGTAGMDLEIDIPAADLPGTETLRGNLLTFDPSDATDARNFPGDYQDGFGNRLVSVAFDSVEITDDAGNSVAELAAQALVTGAAVKANSTGVTVRRWIPSGTCSSVAEFWTKNGHAGVDANNNPIVAQNGNNIPIYTYNPVKGIWDLLGTGTVQVYDTNTTSYTDVTTFVNGDCTQGAYYLNIAISSEDYINAWWNLDYPLLTAQPVQKCVDVTFQDNATPAKPLSGLYAELSASNLTRASGSSRSNGTLKLSGAVTGGTAPTTGTLTYWNPHDYSHQTVDVELGTSPNCATKTVTVTKPQICTVKGTITKNGSPSANEMVWVYSANPYAYNSAYTATNGTFSVRARCDVEMEFNVGNTQKTFRVNGDTTGHTDEVSDDGSEVNLGTIAKANTPPSAHGYLSSYSVKAGATSGTASVTAYFSGWDVDGAADYPLSYAVKVGGTTASNGTGTFVQSDGYKSLTLSGLTEGSHAVTLEVTDKSGTKTTASLGTVEVFASNRAPVISYAYASVGTNVRLNRDGTLPGFNLYAHAYDPDGDALTRGWTCTGCTGTLATGSNIAFAGGAGYTAGSTLTFTYTANDGSLSASRNVDVKVLAARNSTPYFTSTTQSATTLAAPGTVDFTAAASDGDGDTLTYTWYVNDVQAGTGTSHTLTIAQGDAEGDYTVRVSVTDGIATVSRSFTVTYATVSSDTTVIVR